MSYFIDLRNTCNELKNANKSLVEDGFRKCDCGVIDVEGVLGLEDEVGDMSPNKYSTSLF